MSVKKNMYTIFDKVGLEMGTVILSKNDESAQRLYPKAFEGVKVNKNEFSLIRIGTIDVETMRIIPEEIPVDVTPTMAEVVE